MRCSICNKELTIKESEFNPDTGKFKDTCGECNGVIYDTLRATEDQDHKHGWVDVGNILDRGVDDD